MKERIRSISEIGSLWPLCKSCGHIAQSHDSHIIDDGEVNGACSETGPGKCPGCGEWKQSVPCTCKGYVGPTWSDIRALLTEAEIKKYNY